MASGGYELLKSTSVDTTSPPRSRYRLASGIAFLPLAAFLLFKSCLYFLSDQHHPASWRAHDDKGLIEQCVASTVPPASPPAPVNPWSSLTIAEIVLIQGWLFSPEQGLNLTQGEVAVPSDNHIYVIEAYYPPKAAVLNYLSSPSTVDLSPRFARVAIQHGAAQEPIVKNYLVGPLPIGPHTGMSPLTDIYHVENIPYNARAFDVRDWTSPELYSKLAAPLAEAFEELFGGRAAGLPNDTLVAAGCGPFSFDGSFRRLWINWRRNVPGPFLHPLNFYQYVDLSGTDSSQWKLLKIVYNHQVFDTIESFLEALRNGSLKRAPLPVQDTDFSWSTRKRTGARRDLDHLPGPRSVAFAGLRFRVDREQQYVSWMDWGMYLGFDRDMGLSLWDIRFRNERIIYELKPQDALAHYAGNDPFQASTAWLDRYFGMGHSVRDMLPGYDCPYDAVYLPATTFGLTGLLSRDRAICIFEHDSERPLTRHLGYDKDEFGAVKGYQLVIRSIATLGKCFDYIFHLDGTIEVRVSASGYLQAGYWDSDQKQYGARIWETTMGSLHDHVINYKVDLDVAGTANSLLKTTTKQEVVTHPWYDDDWGSEVIQQTIHREYITNEDDALLKFPDNFQGGYSIVNQENKNKWGTVRGYAIHPGYSPIYGTVVGSKRLLKNANWARYNLAISRRKETEPSSSTTWNFNLPGAPPVDFHKFFDGENITQEDLVAWINIGMHHLPQSEDAPSTRTNTATTSFFLTPLNYFDHDVSIDSTNAILLQTPTSPGDPFPFEDYGVRPVQCVPKVPEPFEYAPVHAFDHRGVEVAFESVEAMRSGSELYHRIKFELTAQEYANLDLFCTVTVVTRTVNIVAEFFDQDTPIICAFYRLRIMGTGIYTSIPRFFVQDDADRSSTGEVLPRFGLIDERTDRWMTFVAEIERLNATAELGVQFKVFFLGRHGEGYHNVAEAKYGTKAWTEYWAKLNGDGEIVWGPDPQLTPLGEQQAQEAHAAWEKERQFGIPLPEKLYTSPLTRAIRTNQVTFDDTLFPSGPKTMIVENIREHNGVHTCDKRRTRSEIHVAFPEYHFEKGFTENDELWTPDYRETHDDIDRRAERVLDMIFHNDTEQFISITAHGGFIGGFLRVCQHRAWILPTGGILPVVVKRSVIGGEWRN